MEHKATNQIPPKVKHRIFYRKRLRFTIFRMDGFRCRFCGRTASDGAKLTLDHIVPLSKGGTWSADNLLTACENCNTGKFDSLLTPTELRMFKRPGLLFADWPVVGWRAAL